MPNVRPANANSQEALCYHTSMSSENDNNLINFIATTVEALRARVDTISDQIATKVDLANLKDRMAALEDQMSTKEDLAALKAEMATKNDMGRLETTMKGEFERVHIRLDSIDRGMGGRMGQIETEISRLRSVVLSPGKGQTRHVGPSRPADAW